jgi:hypothetical protein
VPSRLDQVGGNSHRFGKYRELDIDLRDFLRPNRIETGIFERSGSRAVGDHANQGDAGSELADAAAEPAANPEGDESAAEPPENFLGRKRGFRQRLAVLGGQREGAPGHLEEKRFLAISE